MKIGTIFTAIFLFFTAISLVMPDYAEAARMGGGRSFGSRPSMTRPAPTPRQSTAQQRQATTAPTQTPGRMGMMGGLFGGLLAGTLLGSLLGNGMGGSGGFLDIIILGILIFVGYKLFQRFRNRSAQAAAANSGNYYAQSNDEPLQVPLQRADGGADTWSRLKAAVSARDNAPASDSASFGGNGADVPVPPGFDTTKFLEGAKMAYTRMQQSWDNRDLADISQFATGAVMATLQEQMQEEPNPGHTEIMLINAQLLGVEQDGQEERAEVYFDVLMRETPDQKTPENVREIWHFLRMGKNGTWKLDGIQQVE